MARPANRRNTQLLWDDGRLEITVHWRRVGGQWQCRGIDVRVASDHARALRTEDLRGIALGKLLKQAADDLLGDEDSVVADIPVDRPQRQIEAQGPKRRGRPSLPLSHFQEVARVYREANALPGGKPTAAVARHFTVSTTAAAKWVAHCRNDLNLLPKTTRGRSAS